MDLMEDRPYQAFAVIPLIIKYWAIVVAALAVALILGLMTVLAMPTAYTARGIVFPPNATNLESAIRNPKIGYDIAADRLIQLLESAQMRDVVVDKTGLITYYDIDTTDRRWHEVLAKQYRDDIEFTRTRYMSVEITATLEEPEMAATVVNALIEEVDGVRRAVFRSSLNTQRQSLYRSVQNQRRLVVALGDSLLEQGAQPGFYGVLWLYNKLGFPGEQILAQDAIQTVFGESRSLQLQSPDMLLVMDYVFVLDRLEDLQKNLGELDALLSQPVPGVFVVDKANAEYARAEHEYLLRLVILLAGTFVLTLIVLMIRERFLNEAKSGKS